jgi:histidinol-phosphate aminotransferase
MDKCVPKTLLEAPAAGKSGNGASGNSLSGIDRLANPSVHKVIPYQPGKAISEVQRELGLDDIVKLASNENPAGPSSLALEAVMSLLPDIHLYPDEGHELKEALAEKLESKPNNVILGRGATEVLEMITRAFVCPGDQIISAHPSFPWFQMLGRVHGAKNVVVPLLDYKHDLKAMAANISDETKLIFIANPNNPTGTVVEQREIEHFLRRVPDEVVIVFDEAYIEYIARPRIDVLSHIHNRPLISVRTFSKIAGLAGLRIGYAIAQPAIIRLLERVREPFNTTAVAQAAALASLRDEEHLLRTHEIVGEGKQYLYTQFGELGIKFVPSEANFIFVDFQADVRAIHEDLLNFGVIIRPMLESCARITVGTADQNRRLIQALEQVLPNHVERECEAAVTFRR